MGFSSFILIVSASVALFPASEATLGDCFNVGGLLTQAFTPMDEHGAVAFDRIGQYAQYLHGHGINGVIVASHSGEGPSLNVSDNKKLLDAWMEAAPPLNMWVISSVGAVPIPDALEMARYSEEIGVDCIFAVPEVFFEPQTPEELLYNIKLIAEAAPNTAVVFDDIPEYTDVHVDIEEFFDLAKERIQNFRGIKSNVLEHLLILQNKVEEPIRLFASNHTFLAAEVFMGFENFVYTDLNLFPELIIDVINYGQSGYLEESTELYQTLVDRIDAITDDNGHEIAALKEAMSLISGIEMGPPLPPIMPLDDEQKANIKTALIENDVTIVKPDEPDY